MTASNVEVATTDRSGRGYLAGSGIFVILLALFGLFRERSEPGRTTAYFVGQIIGSFVMSTLLAAIIFAIARRATRGKPRSTAAKILFWILAGWFVLMLANFIGAGGVSTASAQSVFSKEDREGLTIGADSLTHTTLRFTLRRSGKNLVRSEMIEREMVGFFGGQLPSDLVYWGFIDSTQNVAFMIQVLGMPSLDKDKFDEYTRGLRNGLAKRLTIVSDTTIWDENRRATQFVAQAPNGVYLGMRCLPSMKPRREYILCIQTFSAEPTTLAKVGSGLTIY